MCRTAIVLAGLVLLASCTTTTPQITTAVLADLAQTGKVSVAINYGNPVFTARGPGLGGVRALLLTSRGNSAGSWVLRSSWLATTPADN